MTFAVANTFDLPFHITPDGQGRKVAADVTFETWPKDPESKQDLDAVYITPIQLGLPYLESAEVTVPEDSPLTAGWDNTTASIKVERPEDVDVAGAFFSVEAHGPPEFEQKPPR